MLKQIYMIVVKYSYVKYLKWLYWIRFEIIYDIS